MLRLVGFFIISILIASCSSALKIEPVSSEYRSPKLIYFVENHGQDKRHLEHVIASELQKKGLNVLSGYKDDRPEKFDILVMYEDRWQWDITNYLIHMRIDLRSPTTNVLLGTGSSYQTSLARKSEDDVIKNIIAEMFSK